MSFYSFGFLFFFFAVWAVVKLLNRADSPRWRNLFLLGASWVFYGLFRLDFLLWLLLVTVITYGFGRLIVGCGEARKHFVTGCAVVLTLLPLLFFKYSRFVCSALRELPGCSGLPFPPESAAWILPVGISFFTFQALSYTIDLCRGKVALEKDFVALALFVAFFPTVLSGPIEKARELLPQIKRRRQLDLEGLVEGAHLFIWGLFKKIVVADRLAEYVDLVYGSAAGYSGKSIALAAICYSIQIYCDFSGYSDMAVGVGRALGFELNRNFDKPYFAVGIRDFWKRWHISLTGWFTEYLYFSCGGNRVSRLRWIGNIMLVFCVSGLWHGANWNFLIWGALHGVFYLIEYASVRGRKDVVSGRAAKILVSLSTFIAVTFAWIFFRMPDFSSAVRLLARIGTAWRGPLSVGCSTFSFTVMLLTAVFVMAVEFFQHLRRENPGRCSALAFRRLSFSVALLWLVELFGMTGKQFVYFLF